MRFPGNLDLVERGHIVLGLASNALLDIKLEEVPLQHISGALDRASMHGVGAEHSRHGRSLLAKLWQLARTKKDLGSHQDGKLGSHHSPTSLLFL